ncbi:hypothetical protein L0657_10660 [Dyadobacter sp. CY345]|uniref:glycosyltransferase n=1 Tax=Dyadobacter sp. CY345 TaxID=2909335 RepID=UPI001F2FCD6C|nr:glycosyltransferase [Dyadobacter sp. CY345]MCF2444416.1 hypothetical protein [Dyadobacter sp. CY345]
MEDKDVRTFIDFIKGRFWDSFITYNKLIEQKPSVAHLLEFEPFSFLYLLLFKKNQIPLLIITVHSIERMRYANKAKDAVSYIQRLIYKYTLCKAASMNASFVTHYQHHKNQLLSLIGSEFENAIHIIHYPCPEVSIVDFKKSNTSNKLLIYGQIREDKGIFEFLSDPETKNLPITIAGKIHDTRILNFNYPNLNIIDKFISDDELTNLVSSHKFMLLPYVKTYTGGAGTLKDSIAYGLPVIASEIPIFEEVIKTENLGFVFKSVNEIKTFTNTMDNSRYEILVSNCSDYAKKYSWESMRKQYFDLYKVLIERAGNQ